jgi:hypothetical protein
LLVQIIGVPALVRPVAPLGSQNAPGVTVRGFGEVDLWGLEDFVEVDLARISGFRSR